MVESLPKKVFTMVKTEGQAREGRAWELGKAEPDECAGQRFG